MMLFTAEREDLNRWRDTKMGRSMARISYLDEDNAAPEACKRHLRRTLGLLLLALLSLSSLANAAESLCEPGFVRGPTSVLDPVPVAFFAQTPLTREVTIHWVGHSSFLIITPGGTAALTDPNAAHPSSITPDVVTISNEHSTHNQAWVVPGNPRLLRGRTPTGEWVEVNVTVGDLSIKSIPCSSGTSPTGPALNTIFVFRAEGLCIVHLGNLRQPLGEDQRRRIGRPDVLMMPIDGQWTLTYEQIALTISQLRPAVVLPMHYDFPRHVQLFMEFIKDRVPVRTLVERTLKVTRGALPASSEVIVLGYREGDG